MYKAKKILALIPARGGSKGLPRKNIKLLFGKPLIAWTIEEARKNTYIDRIIVTTDDKEIAEVSKKYKADVPFLRPQELATDNSSAIDYILHALEWIKENDDVVYDLLLLLAPTSPLRLSEDIDKAIELLFLKEAKAVVSVCKTEHPPYWTNTLLGDGRMKDFIKPETLNKNRQELPNFYSLNGAMYLAYCDYLIKQKGFFGSETFACIMPKERSVDIDDSFDFKLAEFFIAGS